MGRESTNFGKAARWDSILRMDDTGRRHVANHCAGIEWDDMKAVATADGIDSSGGRIDFDYLNTAVVFEANARYPEEPFVGSNQLPHGWSEGSYVFPHIHWLQDQDATPNWLLAYRIYSNRSTLPDTFTLAAPLSNAFDFSLDSPGTYFMQITSFPLIDMTGIRISGWLDWRIYRDSANTSGLFSGADAYSGQARLREYDTHIQLDAHGSNMEFHKDNFE